MYKSFLIIIVFISVGIKKNYPFQLSKVINETVNQNSQGNTLIESNVVLENKTTLEQSIWGEIENWLLKFNGIENNLFYKIKKSNPSSNAIVNPSTLPIVTAFAIQPSCTNGIPNSDGYLQISSVTDGDRYHFSMGSTFDDNSGANIYANATAFTTFPERTATNLPNPAGSQGYTIRVYNGANDCFTDVLVTLNEQDCTIGCDCQDYVYLNEPNGGVEDIHKFSINPDGSLSEIGAPWFDGGAGKGNRFPHGVVADLNGNIFVGDVFSGSNFTAGNPGFIDKFNCDGDLIEDNISTTGSVIPHWGYNIGMIDNNIYIPVRYGSDPDSVKVYNTCDGSLQQVIPNEYRYGWGFTISQDEQSYLYTTGWLDGTDNTLVKGNTDGSGSEVILYTGNSSDGTNMGTSGQGAFMGVTDDDLGNIYVVQSMENNGIGESRLLKFSSTGTLLQTSVWDGTLTQNDGVVAGYYGARGIVWSSYSNRIYVGSAEDCIAVFDTNLNYIPSESIAYVAGSTTPKGVDLLSECCPTNNNIVVDTILCSTSVGDLLFLQDLINCDGTICEGQWQADASNTGLDYNPCDNSITINVPVACGSFTLESDGLGNNPRCGAFKITVNINVEHVTAPVISGISPTCAINNDPVALTIDTPSSGSQTITYQWQSSTTDCTSGWVDIVGAPIDGTAYDPPVLSQETYYRVITSINGSCTSGMCTDTSNCVTLTPEACVEIGNYVWLDSNMDGWQDGTEMGIPGVIVELLNDVGTVIATAITNAAGEYYFTNTVGTNTANFIFGISELHAGEMYTIRIANAEGANQQGVLSNLMLTGTDTTGDDTNDNDASLNINGTSAEITLTAPVNGGVNHTYDFGFSDAPCTITITQNTENNCIDPSTPTNMADDYYTLTINAIVINGGASDQYEVVLGANADGTDGTVLETATYGTAITVGDGSDNTPVNDFVADGTTTYTITIRDVDDNTCFATYITMPRNSCSSCRPTVCLPVQITINKN